MSTGKTTFPSTRPLPGRSEPRDSINPDMPPYRTSRLDKPVNPNLLRKEK